MKEGSLTHPWGALHLLFLTHSMCSIYIRFEFSENVLFVDDEEIEYQAIGNNITLMYKYKGRRETSRIILSSENICTKNLNLSNNQIYIK